MMAQHDLRVILDNINSGAKGLMKIAQELSATDAPNNDVVYLHRAAMAQHEAAVQLEFFMKDTNTGFKMMKRKEQANAKD